MLQAECYNAHQFVERAADFIPDTAVKEAKGGLQKWWWDVRFPKLAQHFEKALQANGGMRLVGNRCSYRQPTTHQTPLCVGPAARYTSFSFLSSN